MYEVDFKLQNGGDDMDKSRFETLLGECIGAVERFVNFKLPSKADADDVLQEVLMSAFRKAATLKDEASFKAWMIRIAQNKCNDFYRACAKQFEIPLEEAVTNALTVNLFGRTGENSVRDTLEQLHEKEKQILYLYFFKNMPQAEIAKQLGIPLGTVKSRLHNAKLSFKEKYPYPPKSKGENIMSKLPETLPEYKIIKSEKAPFTVKWEELMGWFIVPKLGEKISWAMYDFPNRKQSEQYEMAVVGRASVHGIDGVEITAKEHCGGEHECNPESRNLTRTFVAQLTDSHCRILAESHYEGEIKRIFTFLDADEFLQNWGFGEDNCGNEVNLAPKGIIQRDGSIITTTPTLSDGVAVFEKDGQTFTATPFLLDVVGRYVVTLGSKQYDCVCVMDVECYNSGVVTEQFIDKNGKTILWRRFNRDNWAFNRYKKLWSEKLPDNEKIIINGETYIHWYDCITDYIL